MDRHDRGRATSLIGRVDDHGVVYEGVKPMREVVGEEKFSQRTSLTIVVKSTSVAGRCREEGAACYLD